MSNLVSPQAALEFSIRENISSGYRVIWRDASAAQLVKPRPSLNLLAILLFTVAGPLGSLALGFLYLPLGTIALSASAYFLMLTILGWLTQSEKSVFVFLGLDGTIQRIAK